MMTDLEKLVAEQSRTATAVTVLSAEQRIANYIALAGLLPPGLKRDELIERAVQEMS